MAINLRHIPFVLLFLLYCIECITSTNKVNNVHVSMTANFDSVPLLFEITEFFHDYHTSNRDPNKLYFNYINKFIEYYHDTSPPPPSATATATPTQQDIYQWTVSTFNNDIGTTAMESLELALSLNHYTPRLAMFEQLYQNYIDNTAQRQEIIVIQNKNEKALNIAIQNEQSLNQILDTLKNLNHNNQHQNHYINWEIFELHDHWIGDTCFDDANRQILIIYYADYLSSTFKDIYNAFSNTPNSNYCFVLRPISLNKSLKEFNLQGYGVELAIKNMEYNVTDDRNVIANVELDVDGQAHVRTNTDAANDANDVYNQLIHIFNGLIDTKNSSNLPKRLEMEEEDMKNYMNHIDIQATRGLLSSYEHCLDSMAAVDGDINSKKGEKDLNQIKLSNNKFLSIFREFSTNFPRYVEAVSRVQNETFAYLVPYLQTVHRYQREGQQSFALNGINLGTGDFDVFNFYHILHKEAKFVDILNGIMSKYDQNFQNNRLITKLLATPFTIGAGGQSRKGGGGGMMGMFGMGGGGGTSLEEEDVQIDMRDNEFIRRYKKHGNAEKSLKVIAWLNNIERDRKYNNYYKDLKPLKSFMVMQQVVPIKKNMYNGIAIFDPIDFSGYSIFHAVLNGVDQGLPLRLGFVLYPKYLFPAAEIISDADKNKQFISRRIVQCVVWLLDEHKSGKQASIFLSNLYAPILEQMQEKQQKAMQKLMAQMATEEVEDEPFGFEGRALIGDDVEEEDINTLPTANMIESVILDFIVVAKDGAIKTKQGVLDQIYAYDISPYLEVTKAFLDDKGMSSLLEAVENEKDIEIADEKDDKTDVETQQHCGCLLALNGRIFPHIMGEFNVYTLLGILMEEQRGYLMSYASGKISRKTNFNNYVYDKPDVLLRFSKFLSWLGTAGLPAEITTNGEVTDKASNTAITILHPQQLQTIESHIGDELYWHSIYSANTDLTDMSNVYTVTMWLIVNPQSIMGRFLMSAFAKIHSHFAEYGALNDEDNEPTVPESENSKPNPFGMRFAILFNEHSNKIPQQCAALNKMSCQENGVFSWELFEDLASKCQRSTPGSDILLETPGNGNVYGYLTEILGLNSGDNYIILNGEVIPLEILSAKEAIAPITDHDIWTLITRYNDEIGGIMKTLFNEIDGIYFKEMSGGLNNMMLRVSNLLYWRRLHEGFIASQSLFTIADRDENLRTAIDSLSTPLFQNDEDGAPFSIRCVLDPLSPQTQRIISFIDELYDYHNLFDIEILFNPVTEMKEEINRYGFPKKLGRFYRYVFNPNNYIANGEDNSDKAVFVNMPSDDVLTMGITDTPGTWLYESLVCKYDLDNLLLSNIEVAQGNKGNALAVNYHLTRMLIQGQCFDEKSQPVPGLQLELRNNTNLFDATIAMQTLGYWQLKANPGVWEIRLREGRTTQVMEVDANKTKSDDTLLIEDEDSLTIKVVLNSFTRTPFRLRTKHKVGMEKEELLPQLTEEQIEAAEQHRLKEKQEKLEKRKKKRTDSKKPEPESSNSGLSFLDKIKTAILGPSDEQSTETEEEDGEVDDEDHNPLKSLFNMRAETYITPTPQIRIDAKADKETTIHVMSVASGHLYERFLKIMMITTLRNTNAGHVKFWFLKQFLSPRFREFIPHFEREYECSIELVEYRWPEWLRKQTVKQRIIWAYKILFLDVLFPLDLERIIFVDADQVIRSDLLELWNLDLQSKPYAYTPFCDSNLETEGFRFWKQGYWSNHLRGKPYHISALYVVDLVTFRRLRAGDSLRVLYEQLSADPNSLANLDQDLPNFAQHMVPIYSLPQEWLWCETWCSMDELTSAKSIDLCNNPLTKEPKMEKAKRMLPEWKKVDDEATQFENKLIKQGLIAV